MKVLLCRQVDHWLEYSNLLVNGLALEATCARVNDFLALRMYLADHQPTAADIVCWAQLAGTLIPLHPERAASPEYNVILQKHLSI
jgi:hypothetical protein